AADRRDPVLRPHVAVKRQEERLEAREGDGADQRAADRDARRRAIGVAGRRGGRQRQGRGREAEEHPLFAAHTPPSVREWSATRACTEGLIKAVFRPGGKPVRPPRRSAKPRDIAQTETHAPPDRRPGDLARPDTPPSGGRYRRARRRSKLGAPTRGRRRAPPR